MPRSSMAIRERLKAKLAEEWGFAPSPNDLLAKIVAKAAAQIPVYECPSGTGRHRAAGPRQYGHGGGHRAWPARPGDPRRGQQDTAAVRGGVPRDGGSGAEGPLAADDLSGGSFTITNLGTYDVDAFTPVINLPEAAILGVGRIQPKWVYRPESPATPVLRQMWTLKPGVRPPPGGRRAGREVLAVHQGAGRGAISVVGRLAPCAL